MIGPNSPLSPRVHSMVPCSNSWIQPDSDGSGVSASSGKPRVSAWLPLIHSFAISPQIGAPPVFSFQVT